MDVRAKVLAAAIAYVSGTKLVTLGIYSTNPNTGSVGTLLPGGEGSTTRMPDVKECCQLARVILPGDGVLLTGGTTYWLVAAPDNVNAPDFNGSWRLSYQAQTASVVPPSPWDNYPGQWAAAEILGTEVEQAGFGRETMPVTRIREASAGRIIIFTNLNRNSGNLYLFGAGSLLTGKSAGFQPEVWQAVPFTPKAGAHATTLAAAVAWISGTKLVNLGVYSDQDGTVGTLLPGGEGSTTNIPTLGDCCELTKVKLPGLGVALTKGTQYWLVASADDINAPDFYGAWQDSSLAVSAYYEPKLFNSWVSFSGDWSAAEIRGTSP